MRLPRFIRKLIAFREVFFAKEWGGALHDYKNGMLEELRRYDDLEGQQETYAILQSLIDSGRDGVYILTIKTGRASGFFSIEDPLAPMVFRLHPFSPGIYEPDEAFVDMLKSCRALADKKGYRRLDVSRHDVSEV